ncbi:tetratricopeptide repeat protein [Myxococcota bacterium]|nr:tetratricopeptide repeat protein [Myxococcota bacterium]
MPGSGSGLAVLGLSVCLLAPAPALAAGGARLEERFPETVAPPRSQAISWEKRTLAPGEMPDAETLARDPKLLSAWLEQNPEKLDAGQMDPSLLLSIVQMLLSGSRVFEAERLLYQGMKRWPENLDIARRWGGIVVRLGRTEAARETLDRIAPVANDPALYYLLGTIYIRREPRAEPDLRSALAAWERVLALAPDYRDPDGSNAEQIRNAIEKLRKDLPAEPAPVPVAPMPAPPVSAPASGAAP